MESQSRQGEVVLDQQQVTLLAADLVDFTKSKGALYIMVRDGKEVIDHVPFALLPYKINRGHFERLTKIQSIWGRLLVLLSIDYQFITKTLQQTSKLDTFVNHFLQIFKKTHQHRPQKLSFHALRSDYMRDLNTDRYLLVQFNLMAVSMGPLSDLLQSIHKPLLPTLYPKDFKVENFPEFTNTRAIADNMAEAVLMAKVNPLIAFVVEENERNRFDQRHLEFWVNRRGVRTKRVTFDGLAEGCVLEGKTIKYQGEEIGCFYFRTAYDPKSYTTEKHWKLRQMIELSTALSVPTVAMQLINFKRVQQQLTLPVLTKYLGQPDATLLSPHIAKMWNFQDPSTHESLLQLSQTGKYVLKPNRQGGGNNTYGQEVFTKLSQLTPNDRKQYVLMERIYPECVKNYLVRAGEVHEEDCTISEFSIYSGIVSEGGEVVREELGGALVRTKTASCDEGGIASGFSVVSSLYLR